MYRIKATQGVRLVTMLAIMLAMLAVSTRLHAQVQTLVVQSFDSVEAAQGELEYAAAPVALVPAFVKRTGYGAFEMMSWVTIAAPASEPGSCGLTAAASSTPVFGTGGPCGGSGFTPTPTTTVYNSWSDVLAALRAKSRLHQQGCVIVREPGQQALSWVSPSGRYWLTCQESSFSYATGGC